MTSSQRKCVYELLSLVLHTLFFLAIAAAFWQTMSYMYGTKLDEFIIAPPYPFLIIVVALLCQLLCGFGYTCCSIYRQRVYTIPGFGPTVNVPSIIALFVIGWQLILLNQFILSSLIRVDTSMIQRIEYPKLENQLNAKFAPSDSGDDSLLNEGLTEHNVDSLELEESHWARLVLKNGSIVSGEELSVCKSTNGKKYIATEETSKIYFFMRVEMYLLFLVFPLYHYLRYKLDVKSTFNREFCWYLPRLTEAYTLVALDSLEFIFETKNLIPCSSTYFSSAMFIILAVSLAPLIIMLERHESDDQIQTGSGAFPGFSGAISSSKAKNSYFVPITECIQDFMFLAFRVAVIMLLFTQQNKYDFFRYVIHLKTTTIFFTLKNLFGFISELHKIRELRVRDKKCEMAYHVGLSAI